MSAAHTPGPWKLKMGKGIEYTYLISGPGGISVVNWDHYATESKKQTKANARLIAAAPDLLEELENCSDLLSMCFPDAPVDSCIGVAITKARAAIAKATGATQ